jgi:AraC family transcriptional regulator
MHRTAAGTPAPRIEDRAAFRIAGLRERYRYPDLSGLPDHWRRFLAYPGTIPGQIGSAAYGLMQPIPGKPDGFDYLAGMEVRDTAELPGEFDQALIPAGNYAVFEHQGHVSRIRETWDAAWQRGLPEAGYRAADNPLLFERYGDSFDPATGRGVVELWIPVA